MNDLLKIQTNEKQEPVMSGRELYKFLEVGSKYGDWMNRMLEYGFSENADFITIEELAQKKEGSRIVSRKLSDHILKLDMAKEISMIQRNEKGKQARQYFIGVEKEFNSPEKVMARALSIADSVIKNLTIQTSKQRQLIGE